jgi:hypothetical protein
VASCEGAGAAVASKSATSTGNAPARPWNVAPLGIIEEVPSAPLPSPVQLAVQQTVEFAAAAKLPWETQVGEDHSRPIDDREDADSNDDGASSAGSQESQSPPRKGITRTPARFQEIVNRLHNTAEQYQQNRQQRQMQKAHDEAEAASQAKPTINKRSAQMARNNEPLAVRTEKRKALLEKKQETERLKKAEQEIEQLKPVPKINQKSQEICREARNTGVHSQYEWDKQRRQRLEAEQEQRKEEEMKGCTFKPQLSAMSEKLSRQTSNSREVHERLHRQTTQQRTPQAVGSATGGYPSDAERCRIVAQGSANALSFEDFMGLEPSNASSTTSHSGVCSEDRAASAPQAVVHEPLSDKKRRPNPLTKGLPTLQAERRRKEEAERRQFSMPEELRWEDEQEAVNRTVRHLSKAEEPHWEEDEVPRMTPRYSHRQSVVECEDEVPRMTPRYGHRQSVIECEDEVPRMTPRYGLRQSVMECEDRSPDRQLCHSPDSSANRDFENHGTKAMSFESFMMGASLGHQFGREQVSVQSPTMDVGRPLCSTSAFLPADVGFPMGCAAELNVVEYNDRFQDIFSAITSEV